jgi:ribA/ribD-fused uncharacterized protein
MNRSSYFIKNKALFGSFPIQTDVYELENEGVRVFVDLTFKEEKKITPYTTKYKYISYPILDRNIPIDIIGFVSFIVHLTSIIKSMKRGELVYIHCKGGHGRSGVVVAVLLCHIFNMSPEHALEHTTKYHKKRLIMNDKWRKIGSPQTFSQKSFVYKCCKPLNFYKTCNSGLTAGFSNFSLHAVSVEGLGTFHTSEAAIQACKNPSNEEYVIKQQMEIDPIMSKYLGTKIKLREDWGVVSTKLLYKILKNKFDQHPDIKRELMNTRLCPIIHHTKSDNYWGDGGDGSGLNIMGNQLTKLRNNYYMENEIKD